MKESYLSYDEKEYIRKLKDLDILPIKYFFKENDLLLLFKVIHEHVPVTLPLEIVKYRPRLRSRSHNLFKYQLHESLSEPKKILTNSFFVRALSAWNRLPDEIREITQFNSFKNQLKIHWWNEIASDLDPDPVPDSDREPD